MKIIRQFQTRYLKLAQLIDARPTTERVLLFITITLMIYMLVFFAIESPLAKASANIQTKIDTKNAEKHILEQEVLLLTENLRQAPKESKLLRLEALKKELNNTGKFSTLMKDLISPREMVRFVDGVLSSNNKISVVKVKNLPAIKLWPAPDETATTTEQENIETEPAPHLSTENEFTIYRHGMLLEVKGRYRDVVSFFATLEQLPWKILWGEVNLTTDDVNDSVATLIIYTLNPEMAWMGL